MDGSPGRAGTAVANCAEVIPALGSDLRHGVLPGGGHLQGVRGWSGPKAGLRSLKAIADPSFVNHDRSAEGLRPSESQRRPSDSSSTTPRLTADWVERLSEPGGRGPSLEGLEIAAWTGDLQTKKEIEGFLRRLENVAG